MSDARGDSTAVVIDISETFRDPVERDGLIRWGAAYLASNDENVQIRSASLALEYRDLAFRSARSRGQRLSFWQARLVALAMTTAAIRCRAAMTAEESNAVRH